VSEKPVIKAALVTEGERWLRLGRGLRLVKDSAPGWTLASIALTVIQSVLPLPVLYLMKLVVDTIASSFSAAGSAAALRQVVPMILVAGAIALLGAFCRSLAGMVNDAQARAVTDHIFDLLHAKSVEVDIGYYENSSYYDALHRAQEEAAFKPARIVNEITQLSVSGLSLIGIGALIVSLYSWMAGILVLAAVPGVVARFVLARREYEWRRSKTFKDRMAAYFHCMLTWEVYAKEVRLFGLGQLFRRRFSKQRQELRVENLRFSARRAAIDAVIQASAIAAIFGCFAFMARQAVRGAATIGSLVMFYQAFQRGQDYLSQMLTGLAALYEDGLFIADLADFLDLKPTVASPMHPVPLPRPLRGGIVFDAVSFRYPDSVGNVLEDVSLTVKPGEVVALIGENGTGKTTLIKLLSRLYDPTKGAIKIDGIDLRELSLDDLRDGVSVIFQDFAHYHLTARENIWLGNTSLSPQAKRVIETAREAGLDDVISRLPQGYDTILGKLFEGGRELSMGEWQKVALARALVRDAQIIVLDEPTSAMDALAEYEIFSRFRELAAGRTAIIISHRLSTVRMADYIYVLEGGKITEGGTHCELVNRGGKYACLFETQAQSYR
jgi:ATP-binding cassette subfamily B protein